MGAATACRVLALLLVLAFFSGCAQPGDFPSDEEIDELLAKEIAARGSGGGATSAGGSGPGGGGVGGMWPPSGSEGGDGAGGEGGEAGEDGAPPTGPPVDEPSTPPTTPPRTPPLPGQPTPDPFMAQSARNYIEFIVEFEGALVSQLVTALQMAEAALPDGDPLKQRLYERVQRRIDETVNNPRSTIKELLETAELAQSLGIRSGDAMERVMEEANERLEAVLADPDAPIPDLLAAAQLTQQLGVDEEGKGFARVLERIQQKLTARLQAEDFCQQQLYDIAEIAQKLGIAGVDEIALQKAGSAPRHCATLDYESRETGETNRLVTATVTANLKEFSMFGFTSEQGRSYTFKDGSLVWRYTEDPEEGSCFITRREGSGTIDLADDPATSISVHEGSPFDYTLSIVKTVQLTVYTQPAPGYKEEECGPLPDAERKEDYYLSINARGSTGDRLHLKDVSEETYEGSSGTETTRIQLDMRLPDTATAIDLEAAASNFE